mmetsp:Transcript_40967/g.130945  ORF Transcript_40967/g.130945 Transcript_40967/m.130945 type:complete len:236 (-) Transcript_40967:330-1037(-)
MSRAGPGPRRCSASSSNSIRIMTAGSTRCARRTRCAHPGSAWPGAAVPSGTGSSVGAQASTPLGIAQADESAPSAGGIAARSSGRAQLGVQGALWTHLGGNESAPGDSSGTAAAGQRWFRVIAEGEGPPAAKLGPQRGAAAIALIPAGSGAACPAAVGRDDGRRSSTARARKGSPRALPSNLAARGADDGLPLCTGGDGCPRRGREPQREVLGRANCRYPRRGDSPTLFNLLPNS